MRVAQTQRIELDTELSGPCALFLQRLPIGPGQTEPIWEMRAVDELGTLHNRRGTVDEIVDFLRAIDGVGAPVHAH